MLFFLFPAALMLALAGDPNAAVTQAVAGPQTSAVKEPTFDPNAPPSWWTTKMRQPCTKSGDRIVC